MALLLIEGRFLFARSSWGDCSEQSMGPLGATSRFAGSERPFLSQREAVLLFFPGQGIFTRWAGSKFSLG